MVGAHCAYSFSWGKAQSAVEREMTQGDSFTTTPEEKVSP